MNAQERALPAGPAEKGILRRGAKYQRWDYASQANSSQRSEAWKNLA